MCNRVAIVRSGQRSSTRARSPISSAAPGPPTGSRRPRTSARSPSAAPSAGSRRARRAGTDLVHRRRGRGRELRQALVEAGALIHELAPQTVTLEDLFFSLTEGDRGTRARPRTRAPRAGGGGAMNPGGAHRLPLGADQAPLPEAHLPRASARRRSSRSCSCRDPLPPPTGAGERLRVRAATSTAAGWRSRSSSCCSARSGCSRSSPRSSPATSSPPRTTTAR